MARARSSNNNSTANLGFESRARGIWFAADIFLSAGPRHDYLLEVKP